MFPAHLSLERPRNCNGCQHPGDQETMPCVICSLGRSRLAATEPHPPFILLARLWLVLDLPPVGTASLGFTRSTSVLRPLSKRSADTLRSVMMLVTP